MSAKFDTCHIREWTASYYDNIRRKWLYGTFSLLATSVKFFDGDFTMTLRYQDIADVRKTTTGLIFRAVVMTTQTGLKHWLSSLNDVNGVFQSICFFQRSRTLLGSNGRKKDTRTDGHTEMGTRLLKVAHDSKETLKDAAENLVSQGYQLDSAMCTMMDINTDLDVAENLISGMEAWFGRWSLPEEYKTCDPVMVDNSDLSTEIEHEILYTRLETNKMNPQNLGLLRIAKDGLFIMTDKQKLVHHFPWTGISRVRVVNLWEIIVTRYLIGQPDLSYSVVFSTVYSVLRILDRRLKSKVEYSLDAFRDSDPEMIIKSNTNKDSRQDKGQLFKYKDDHQVEPSLHLCGPNTESDQSQHSKLQLDQSKQSEIQINQSKEIVSEEEVAELSNILGDLKSLALGVQEETSVQNEKIESLTKSVDEANVRITQTEKRVKKMF